MNVQASRVADPRRQHQVSRDSRSASSADATTPATSIHSQYPSLSAFGSLNSEAEHSRTHEDADFAPEHRHARSPYPLSSVAPPVGSSRASHAAHWHSPGESSHMRSRGPYVDHQHLRMDSQSATDVYLDSRMDQYPNNTSGSSNHSRANPYRSTSTSADYAAALAPSLCYSRSSASTGSSASRTSSMQSGATSSTWASPMPAAATYAPPATTNTAASPYLYPAPTSTSSAASQLGYVSGGAHQLGREHAYYHPSDRVRDGPSASPPTAAAVAVGHSSGRQPRVLHTHGVAPYPSGEERQRARARARDRRDRPSPSVRGARLCRVEGCIGDMCPRV